jgi:methionine-rich copper-binding protein CopC
MRKAAMAAVLGSLITLVSPAPAHAHADLVRSSPANGSTVATAPSSIRITFNEPVTLDSAALLDSSGASIPHGAQVKGATVTLIPASPLRPGITAATFSVTSDDGHHVEGALSFVIGRPPTPGSVQAITTIPSVRTTLSGSHPGRLTASFGRRAASGEVVWTSPSLKGSLTWPVRPRGKTSIATGVLPFPGAWTMQATLAGPSGAIVVTTGTATLIP